MEKELIEIFNTVLGNRSKPLIDEVTEEMHIRNDIGFDSLDLAELTVRIESIYDVDIFQEGIVNTVGEIIERLEA